MAKKPGPEPERLKIHGDWKAAAAKIMQVKKPAKGWPSPTPKKKRKKAKR